MRVISKVDLITERNAYAILTIGKSYDAIQFDDDFCKTVDYFIIKDDTGSNYIVDKKYFKSIDEIREEKLNELLND